MQGYRPVPVWDGVVRTTHAINALCVLALLALGGLLWGDEWLGIAERVRRGIVDLHAAIGFLFAASLGVRLAQLLGESDGPASWRDLWPASAERRAELRRTLGYYLSGLRGDPPLYFAHNALAGIAYLVFFALGISQALSGAAIYLLAPEQGVAYAHEAHRLAEKWPPAWLEAWHEAGAILVLLFVIAHLGMVVVHELRERRGLASAMISGCKFFREDELARLERRKQQGGER